VTPPVRPEPRPGQFEEPFWEWLDRGQLRLQRCSECGQFRYTPRSACAHCLSDQFTWEPLAGTGTLLSWVVFRRQYLDQFPPPYVVAVVATDEGPIMTGNIAGAGTGDGLRIGARVEAFLEQAQTVAGRAFTICQWKVVDA
jgi:uncharacterized OB-fold protein